jgi:hypothetical protein
MLATTLLLAALLLSAKAAASSRPPHYRMWMCVHHQEHTAWNDPNPPYLGGLQLGTGWFVPHYLSRVPHPPGLPHQWSPLQQMWFAERAYRYERYSHSWLWGQWPPSRGVCF